MSEIIKFEEKQNKVKEIPAGATFTINGQVTDKGTLKNRVVIPTDGLSEKAIEDMISYQKRFVIAQAVDEAMKRVQADDSLKDKPFTLTINPQELKPDENGYALETTLELGVP